MKKMLLFVAIFTLIISAAYYAGVGTGHLKNYLSPKSAAGQAADGNATDGKISANLHSAQPAAPTPTPAPGGKYLVFIDPGHGGNDPGTSGNGLVEKDISLDVSLRLEKLLKESGVQTSMTRTGDTYMDHKDRILLANSKGATLFVSVHCDWFENSSYGGTQTLYYPSRSLKAGNMDEIQYAELIQSELIKVMETNNRGIADRPNLAVLRHAQMPSVLVELGFLSNKNDAARLGNPDFRQKVAQGFTNGILKALKKVEGQ